MSYRPITDMWILARPKVRYYGAYPAGFLSRARDLLGVDWTAKVLHVCSGKVRDYPYKGVGQNDRTVDISPELGADFTCDVSKPGWVHHVVDIEFADTVSGGYLWDAVLADPPYTDEDARQYGDSDCPLPGQLLRDCLRVVKPGRRVGILHYQVPRPPKDARFVACVGVMMGYGNNLRAFSVFERAIIKGELA